MRYELVIFDWDGTLMDSVPRIVSCMQTAGIEAGLGTLPQADIENNTIRGRIFLQLAP